MRNLFRSSSILAVSVALVACTGTIRTQGELDLSHIQAEEALAQARSTANDDPTGPVRVRSGVYLAGATTPLDGAGKLPVALRNKNVVFVSAFSLQFREIADLILKQTGVPVSYRGNPRTVAGALPSASSSPSASAGSVISTPPTVNGVTAAQRAQEMASAGASASSIPGDVPTGTMVLNYEGSFSGLLTLIASNYGLNWTYRDGIIEFATTQTATFNVPALAVLNKLSFTLEGGVQNAGGSGGSGPQQTGGSSQKASTDMAVDVWKDLTLTLKNLVGAEGTIDISGSTGTVTVNAPVGVVAQVKSYLTEINKQLSRAIKMDIAVYAVTLKQGDDYNLSVGAVNAGTEVGTVIGSGGASAASTAASILAKATSSTSNGFGAAIINPNSEWNGTNGVFKALSSRGDVSIVTSATITTLNGIEAPFQVTNTRDYVSQVSTTTTGSTGSNTQTTLTPSSVTTGFTFYVVPRVDNNGIVQLQYGMNLSELIGANNGFDTFTTGGQTVQLKNVDSRNFVQQAAVPAGGTLILTGFEQKKASQSDSGTGDYFFPLFGGGKTASTGRQIIIISITPKVTSFGTPRSLE